MAAALTVRTESHPVECGAHVYRYGGRRPLDRSSIHPDCARPFRLACSVPGCPAYLVISCDASDDRKCAPCAKRYRGRVQHIAESVLDLLADGDGLFITTTPPGDRQHGPKGNPCPCTPAGGVELDRWNAQQGRRVNSFRTQLRRLLARQGVEVDYFRCVETQDGHRRADGVGRMGLQVRRPPVCGDSCGAEGPAWVGLMGAGRPRGIDLEQLRRQGGGLPLQALIDRRNGITRSHLTGQQRSQASEAMRRVAASLPQPRRSPEDPASNEAAPPARETASTISTLRGSHDGCGPHGTD
jgi:hypothetical protein